MAYELRNSQPDPVVADEDSEELEYDVEVILKARCVSSNPGDVTHTGSKTIPGIWDYFVKWGGYDDSWNSWQSPGSMDCPRLVKEFWDDFDFDELMTEDIEDGVVYASQEWIEYQKEYFANKCDIVTIVDDTPVTEEIYDPFAEPGSSSEEEDENMDEDEAEEDEEEPAQEENGLDEICAAREFDFQHMYPSPMSMIMEDDGVDY